MDGFIYFVILLGMLGWIAYLLCIIYDDIKVIKHTLKKIRKVIKEDVADEI